MRRSRSTAILYAILGSGVALAFLGHGILAAKGEAKFVELVTGSYDQFLGGTMSTATATDIVNVIGWIDIAAAVVFVGLVIAALRDKPVAYGPPALGLFACAAIWGFVTALARFTAVMNGAETWDVVERGPNYLLPAGLAYMIYRLRKDAAAKDAAAGVIASAVTPNGKPERELTGAR